MRRWIGDAKVISFNRGGFSEAWLWRPKACIRAFRGIWYRCLMKRRRALLGSNPPGNSQADGVPKTRRRARGTTPGPLHAAFGRRSLCLKKSTPEIEQTAGLLVGRRPRTGRLRGTGSIIAHPRKNRMSHRKADIKPYSRHSASLVRFAVSLFAVRTGGWHGHSRSCCLGPG